MKPYTYIITHKPSGKKYYGVRYAIDSDPSDLFESYFTSSKYIHSLIERDGKDSFEIGIRKTFDNVEDAVRWEAKVLRRLDAKNSDVWLNKHNGDGEFISSGRPKGFNHSDETIEKIKKSNCGIKKPKSDEFKKQVSKTMKEKFSTMSEQELTERMNNSWHSHESWTDERKQKISVALVGKEKTDQHKMNMSIGMTAARKRMSDGERKQTYGSFNKGKSWKLVDGKRVWYTKEENENGQA